MFRREFIGCVEPVSVGGSIVAAAEVAAMAAVEAYQTANGRRYRVRYRKPDRTQTDKRGFRTRRDAELFLASVEVSIARGEFVDASAARAPIGELGAAWIRDLTHVKPSYWRSLESTWRRHVEPRWGTVAVAAVRHSEVQSWVSGITDAGLSPSTAHRAYGILASILDVAVKDRRIMSNPARGIRLPRKVKREHTYLTDAQVASLALAAGKRGLLVLVLAYCGLRWGEAIGLRVKDLDMLRRRLNVTVNAVEVGGDIIVGTPKTHKRRSVPFPQTLAVPLAQACEGKGPNDLVFADRPGVHLRRSKSDDGWFSDAVIAAGLPRLTPHDLRHTAASLAVRSGANVKAVQRMLGHASAAMTLDVYADLFDDDLDAVATRLDVGLAATDVGKLWASPPASQRPARKSAPGPALF